MKTIGIVGFGGLGQQLYKLLVEEEYQPKQIVIFDDYLEKQIGLNVKPFQDYKKYDRSINYIIALGYKQLKLKSGILEELRNNNCSLYTYIHPTAFISKSAKIGGSSMVFSGSIIEQNVELSDGCICYYRTTVSHDCYIGQSTFLAPSVTVCGNVNIGSNCFIGAGTIVGNGIKIGGNVKIGMQSSVQKNIVENSSCIGNPLKMIDLLVLK